MAVKVSQFFAHHRNNTIALLVLIEILLIVLTAAFGWMLYEEMGLEPAFAFFIALGTLLVAMMVLTPLVYKITGNPLKVISQAIAHVSNDPVQTPPPEINNPIYERTGLKAMVQTIYELAVSSQKEAGSQEADAKPPLYRALFNNAPCGIIALNDKGEVIMANKTAPVHPGADEKLELELLFEQTNGLDTWLEQSRTSKVRDTKAWHRIADSIPGEDGRRIFDVLGYYNKNGEQNIDVILITIDKTAEYAPDDEDMDFIALAAHELRGPITVVRGYLDLLDDELGDKLQPDQQELVDRLQVSAEQLSGYINNILNVSRYDRNHLSLHLHEEKLLDLIKNLLPDLALRAKTKKRRLTFHIPEDLPTIAADRSSLSEVISNLIDNAIKYSKDNGEVIVSAAVKGNFVEMTVQDFGIGMPGAVVGNLFSKFYRSHRSRQQVSGTGLGLYICKAIVESHGGSIWVRSKEGEGSTFGFTMPIYSTVADKLGKDDNGNEQIIERADGWIKNHAMYRR